MFKRCSKCGEEKPATPVYFYRRKDRPLGLMSCCKVCKEATNAKYWTPERRRRKWVKRYARDKVQLRAKTKRYIEEHRDWHRAIQKRYRKEKPTLYRQYDAKRYRKHRPERLRRALEYQARNLDRVRIVQENRRAQKLAAGGRITKADVERMWTKQEGRCAYCSNMLTSGYHLEHKIPLSRGGTHTPDNVCLSCKTCNFKKHTMTAEEFMERQSACSNY